MAVGMWWSMAYQTSSVRYWNTDRLCWRAASSMLIVLGPDLGRFAGPAPAILRAVWAGQQRTIRFQEVRKRMVPGQCFLNPATPIRAHRLPAVRIVHQLRQCVREREFIVGTNVQCCLLSGDAMLPQIEGDDRPRQCHIIHDFVHRRTVGEWIRGIRRHTDICCREIADEVGLGYPAREPDVRIKVKLPRECLP